MKFTWIAATALATAAAPSLADGHLGSGDPAAGESAFRQCQTCHVVVNDAGETLAGRNARTGPNLYGLAGAPAGAVEGFRYSSALAAAGEAGLVWDEANMIAYLKDPTGFLREFLDDSGARGQMAFRVRSDEDAANLYAFIASLSAN